MFATLQEEEVHDGADDDIRADDFDAVTPAADASPPTEFADTGGDEPAEELTEAQKERKAAQEERDRRRKEDEERLAKEKEDEERAEYERWRGMTREEREKETAQKEAAEKLAETERRLAEAQSQLEEAQRRAQEIEESTAHAGEADEPADEETKAEIDAELERIKSMALEGTLADDAVASDGEEASPPPALGRSESRADVAKEEADRWRRAKVQRHAEEAARESKLEGELGASTLALRARIADEARRASCAHPSKDIHTLLFGSDEDCAPDGDASSSSDSGDDKDAGSHGKDSGKAGKPKKAKKTKAEKAALKASKATAKADKLATKADKAADKAAAKAEKRASRRASKAAVHADDITAGETPTPAKFGRRASRSHKGAGSHSGSRAELLAGGTSPSSSLRSRDTSTTADAAARSAGTDDLTRILDTTPTSVSTREAAAELTEMEASLKQIEEMESVRADP